MKFETAVNKIEAGLGGGVNDEQGIAALLEQLVAESEKLTDVEDDKPNEDITQDICKLLEQLIITAKGRTIGNIPSSDHYHQNFEELFDQFAELSPGDLVIEANSNTNTNYVANTNFQSWQNTDTNGIAHAVETILATMGRWKGWSQAYQNLKMQLPPPEYNRNQFNANNLIVFADGVNLCKKLGQIYRTGSGVESTVPMNPNMRFSTFRARSQVDRGYPIKTFVVRGQDTLTFSPIIEDNTGHKVQYSPIAPFAGMVQSMATSAAAGRGWNAQQLIDLDNERYTQYVTNNFKVLKEAFYNTIYEVAYVAGTPAGPDTTIMGTATAVSGCANATDLITILNTTPISYIENEHAEVLKSAPKFTMGGKKTMKASSLTSDTLAYPQNQEYATNIFFTLVNELSVADANYDISKRIGYVSSDDASFQNYLKKLYKQTNVLGLEHAWWNRPIQKFHKFMDGIKTAGFNLMQA